MKKMIAVLAMGMMLVATSAFADVLMENHGSNTSNQTTNVTTTNTATGGHAASAATGGNVDFKNSYISPVQPYNPNTPGPILSGPELRLGEWGLLSVSNGYTASLFEGVSVTKEQAISLSKRYPYSNFWGRNRLGDEAIMTENLSASSSIVITNYWGRMGNDQYVASFPVFGKKGDQLEGLIGLALKRAMELGATKVGILIRTVKEVNTKGLSMGTGAGAGLYIPCNSGVGTGVNFGAYISHTKTDDMYELNVVCLKGDFYEPPVVTEKPCPPAACDPSWLLAQILIWDEACKHCPGPCFNNEMLRYNMGNYYVAAHDCTKDTSYLLKAIAEYDKGERDCLNGVEPDGTKTRTMKGAQDKLKDLRYNKSWCIRLLYGVKAQHAYAKNNGLTSVPTSYADIHH
ncbi:MAG: hypothetical protein PHW24_01570 [Candidatus Moranbacteria bacterium]|nr:hypothetical protein [Candidatus Moranbacteria bacterium]